MELSDLEVFRTVANEGGISRAASKLHRVPSNITARIQKLESELGKALFIRDKNRLKISASGSQLLDYADQILNLADEAKAAMNTSVPQGTLRIGSMEAVAATRLSVLLSSFHQQYGEVDLKVQTNPTGRLIEQVIAGDIDLAFVADPPEDSRLNQLLFHQETMVLVSDCQQNAIKKQADIGASMKLLGFSAQCSYRKTLEDWAKHSNICIPMAEISSYHALLSCAAAGMGIGIVPKSLLQCYPFSHTLRTHGLQAPWNKSNTCLIWRRDADTSSLAAFITLVKEQVA